MSAKCASSLGLVLLLGSAALAAADPITITADRRTTVVLARVTESDGTFDRHTATQTAADALSSQASATTALSSGSAAATLTSGINGGHLFGNGTAATSFNTAYGADTSAASTFFMTFQLDGTHQYAFDSLFGSSGSQETGAPTFEISRGQWTARLFTGAAHLFNFTSTLPGTRASQGFLGPGSYTLMVESTALGMSSRGAAGSASANFDFTLDLTPVAPTATPEPASLLLLGTGAGLLWRRVRRAAA